MLRVECVDGVVRYINPKHIIFLLDNAYAPQGKVWCSVYCVEQNSFDVVGESAWQLSERIKAC